jgi:ABC-2 type transport system ATP-binding protein
VVDVSHLSVHHGPIRAVTDVSFTVEAGQVVAVLGPNGAGKTTTIETVEGFHRPSSGAVRVFGLDPRTGRHAVTTRWGVMPQQGGLPMGLRAGEVVALFAALAGHRSDPAALLDLVGLADRAGRPWRRLSGGEQQRLSLAAALVGRPELLLLDEPTAALDPQGRRQVMDLIRARADDGAAVLVTTHLLDDVEALCDRVVVLDRGEVAAAGSVAELTGRNSVVTFTAPGGLDLGDLAAELGAAVVESAPGRYRVEVPPSPEAVAAVAGALAVRGVTPSRLGPGDRLEDVFVRLTDGRRR